MTLRRIALPLAAVVLFVLWAGPAVAQPSNSPLLNGLSQALRDPDVRTGMLPDNSALIISSQRHGDFSLGRDGRMRAHRPGTTERLMTLSGGSPRACIGACLGHKGNSAPKAPAMLQQALQSGLVDFGLRRNTPGFTGKQYTPENRPFDIKADNLHVMVRPDGRTYFREIKKGPVGFALPGAKKDTRARRGMAPAPSVPQPGGHGVSMTGGGAQPLSVPVAPHRSPIQARGISRSRVTGISTLRVGSRPRARIMAGGRRR